jgi:hypothetical protein
MTGSKRRRQKKRKQAVKKQRLVYDAPYASNKTGTLVAKAYKRLIKSKHLTKTIY